MFPKALVTSIFFLLCPLPAWCNDEALIRSRRAYVEMPGDSEAFARYANAVLRFATFEEKVKFLDQTLTPYSENEVWDKDVKKLEGSGIEMKNKPQAWCLHVYNLEWIPVLIQYLAKNLQLPQPESIANRWNWKWTYLHLENGRIMLMPQPGSVPLIKIADMGSGFYDSETVSLTEAMVDTVVKKIENIRCQQALVRHFLFEESVRWFE